MLPADLVVRAVTPAPDGFDARFAAIWRRYVYRLSDRTAGCTRSTASAHVSGAAAVDLDRMNASAAVLLGLQDFAAFCKQREGATTVRTLLDLPGDRRRRPRLG